jgi:hypothetical protein
MAARGGAITDRDREVLDSLSVVDWLRPMDIGGRNGSHHAATLVKLVRYGLVEQRRRKTFANAFRAPGEKRMIGSGGRGQFRGSWEYRRVDMVNQAIALAVVLAGYECAGIDQDVDDTRLCGQCAPCEANKFLDRWGLRK